MAEEWVNEHARIWLLAAIKRLRELAGSFLGKESSRVALYEIFRFSQH
jgi:hypothetical protein